MPETGTLSLPDTTAAVQQILETVSTALNHRAFESVRAYAQRSRQDDRTPPLANIVELASQAAAATTQFDAWILARGQSAYTPLTQRTARADDDPCTFTWTDPATSGPLTTGQAAYQIQRDCLDTLDTEARTALTRWANTLIATDRAPTAAQLADVAKALSERVSEYQQHWCAPTFKIRSGPDEPWLCCDSCDAVLTHLNVLTANSGEALCVMCGAHPPQPGLAAWHKDARNTSSSGASSSIW